jgi:hypothetical protein
MTIDEQDALARAVLRATSTASDGGQQDSRDLGDLRYWLAHLSRWQSTPVVGQMLQAVPELTVILERRSTGDYLLDLDDVRARCPWKDAPYVDLVVEFDDQTGRQLTGRLEDAPSGVATVDPATPPPWLHPRLSTP